MKTSVLVLAALGMTPTLGAASSPRYPPAHIVSEAQTYFGTSIQDPYRWLENKESSATQAWVQAEDTQAKAFLDKYPGRQTLAKRLKALYDVDETSLPIFKGGKLFYTHRLPGQEKASVYWRESSD